MTSHPASTSQSCLLSGWESGQGRGLGRMVVLGPERCALWALSCYSAPRWRRKEGQKERLHLGFWMVWVFCVHCQGRLSGPPKNYALESQCIGFCEELDQVALFGAPKV